MSASSNVPTSASATAPIARRPWAAPRIVELPRLTELTLQSGIPGDTSGGTVF